MTTFLAQQLKKLAVPQTTLLLQTKSRPSLLFDPKEAATLDRNTVFAIGCTGLEELKLINPDFAEFENTLFNESAKYLERSVQDKDTNAKLNLAIQQFLFCVSPYILLRPAHKALEWLIHRFHIHMFNVEELIGCIIPYHETRIFVRILQLIDLSNPGSQWHWLEPLQKPGIPLTKAVLFTQCYSELSFMKFICDLVPKTLEVFSLSPISSKAVISFYAVTIIGALEQCKTVTEEIVALLLSYILKGLKSKHVDYCAASFMIISQVTKKTALSYELLDKICVKILQKSNERLRKEAILCLVVIFQFQKMKKVPDKLLKSFWKNSALLEEVGLLSESYQLSYLLDPFFRRLLPKALKGKAKSSEGKVCSEFKFLFKIFKNVRLEDKSVSKVVKIMLSHCSTIELGKTEDVRITASKFLNHLETRYPTAVDKAVDSFLLTASDTTKKKVQKLLYSVSSSKTSLLGKNHDLIFLSLSHQNESRRIMGMKALLQLRRSGKVDNKDFVKDCVLPRLNDDSPKVVQVTLEFGKALFELVPQEEMFSFLCELLEADRLKMAKWFEVKKSVLGLLCDVDLKNKSLELRLALSLLPFFLTSDERELDVLENVVINSSFVKTNLYLGQVGNELSSYISESGQATEKKMSDFNKKSLQVLTDSTQTLDKEYQEQMLAAIMEISENKKTFPVATFIGLRILRSLMDQADNMDKKVGLGQKCLDFSKKAFNHTNLDRNSEETVEILTRGGTPFIAIFTSLQYIIHIKTESVLPGSPAHKLQVDLFHFLSINSVMKKGVFAVRFASLLEEFFEAIFKNGTSIEEQLRFLSLIWIECLETPFHRPSQLTQSSDHSTLTRLSFLVFDSVLLKSQDFQWFIDGNNSISFMLLAGLSSSNSQIRSLCLKCMSTIFLKSSDDSQNSFKELFGYLIQYEEEISADQQQFPQILSQWLSPVLVGGPVLGITTRRKSANMSHAAERYTLLEILRLFNSSLPDKAKLGVLYALKECNSQDVLSELSKLLVTILVDNEPVGKILPVPSAIQREILSKYSSRTAMMLTSLDVPIFKVLERSFSSKLLELDGESLQQMVVKVISRKFFSNIPSDGVKQRIIGLILNAYVDSEDSTKESLLWKAMKKICIDGKLISKELQINDSTVEIQTMKEARLIRATTQMNKVADQKSENGIQAAFNCTRDWKKVMAMLEIIQSRTSIENVELLVAPLFDLLKKSLDFESNPQLEYLRQLILSSIYNCCTLIKANNIKLPEQSFQVELAVQCIRISPNPHTHHHALLVLNLSATIHPEHVLHNIMAIFTFMGANLVRQDDSYSFQMIIKTVDTIIPALMQASQCQKESDTKTPIIVAAVTQVFVDALKDIPPHRQLPLFSKLISMLGPSKYLWFPLLQIFGNVATTTDTEAKERGSLPKAVEFAIDLCHSVNPALQVSACLKIIQYLEFLPNTKDLDLTANVDREFLFLSSALFDAKLHSEKELRHFKYTAISFVAALLSSKEFVAQVIDLNPELVSKLQVLYRNLLEATMQYLQQVGNQVQINANLPTFKFWRALQHKLYDVLEKVNSLLPNDQFIAVVNGLLRHQTLSVCRKAMEMLNSKLSLQSGSFSYDDIILILDLVKPLSKLAKGKKRNNSLPDKEEHIINQQTALMSLKLICKLTGSSHPTQFTKVLRVLIRLLHRSSHLPPLMSSSLLCLAELCQNLKAHCLPYLTQFMPIIVELLEDTELLESNELLLLSVVTTVHRIVENLSGFLSTYLLTLVTQICKLSAEHPDDDTSAKNSLHYRLRSVKTQIATMVPARVLIPVITQCYKELATNPDFQTALGPLMSILKQGVSEMNKQTLSTYLVELQNFFLTALSFRQLQNKTKLTRIDFVEVNVIDAMMTFVLKLSEASFRPIFYRVFEWATMDEEESKERTLTFYRLTSSLAERLKSLFVLFASHFVKNAADVLEANNEEKDGLYFGSSKKSKEKSCHLLKYLLRTLHICFLHDNKCLVDQQCFETLMQPLVDQIENQIGSEEEYQDRIKNYLSPCLSHFAVASADDTSWKPFNYQILLKTRHSSPKVRFAALEVLQDLVQKLGDDYMVLLPESIPFLAELMEDESFEVEQQCQAVVAKMELILGEPLMKYF